MGFTCTLTCYSVKRTVSIQTPIMYVKENGDICFIPAGRYENVPVPDLSTLKYQSSNTYTGS